MAKVSPLVPECFGKFHDPKAAECRICLDRTLCSAKTRSNGSEGNSATSLVDINNVSYQVKAPTTDAISGLLARKQGQIAKALHHGEGVTLALIDNKLRVTVSASHLSKEDIMAGKKGAPVVDEVEELDEELEGEELESEDEELEDEDGIEDSEESEDEGTEEEAAPAPAPKAKKEPKPKPTLNKAQQEFQDKLDACKTTEEKQALSQKVIKQLGVKHDNNADARVAHMQRVMAIKKHLAIASAPAKVAAKKAAKK